MERALRQSSEMGEESTEEKEHNENDGLDERCGWAGPVLPKVMWVQSQVVA